MQKDVIAWYDFER